MAVTMASSAITVPVPEQSWPLTLRIGYRFVFCWWVLYLVPFPFGGHPGRLLPAAWYDQLWYKLVPGAGRTFCICARPSQPSRMAAAIPTDGLRIYVRYVQFHIAGPSPVQPAPPQGAHRRQGQKPEQAGLKLSARQVQLQAVPMTSFLLANRGFHWINERPVFQ